MTTSNKPKGYGRPVQAPEHHFDPGPCGGDTYGHPAYAQISASRVSGRAVLYGSDFYHQHTIRIRIAASTVRRSLSSDWPHSSITPFIEVEMSEAQWATFVSSLNMGEGVQCTLRQKDGKAIPELPDPISRSDQFTGEALAKLKLADAELAELVEAIAATGLSKAKQAELLRRVNVARSSIGNNLTFVADQFSRHVEDTTERAKSEINAYATAVVQRAGLQALGIEPVAPIAYEPRGEDHEQSDPQAAA